MNTILKLSTFSVALFATVAFCAGTQAIERLRYAQQTGIGSPPSADTGGGSSTGVGSGSPGSNVGAGAGGNDASGARKPGAYDLSNRKDVPLGRDAGNSPRKPSPNQKSTKP